MHKYYYHIEQIHSLDQSFDKSKIKHTILTKTSYFISDIQSLLSFIIKLLISMEKNSVKRVWKLKNST